MFVMLGKGRLNEGFSTSLVDWSYNFDHKTKPVRRDRSPYTNGSMAAGSWSRHIDRVDGQYSSGRPAPLMETLLRINPPHPVHIPY